MSRTELNEEVVFDIARRIEDAEVRKDYVDQACASDPALKARVNELLRLHDEESSFLESPPEGLPPTVAVSQVTEKVGQTIGRYTLREQIGEGGMGVVYVAEQQRPIRRKVALKVIKPGMDSKAVLARFEAEQQALALMNHRNIAKVLDAGIAESGRPYFVMELVSGIPITEYCDEKRLIIEERLKLFVRVCRAIQHAHQKGIIHRDIKPSNVLVTEEDGEAIPKVIDFGVAKALSHKLTDRTVYTSFQAFLGTPLYASPEQASLSNVDVDTRSDVYSLGVLLYELLTGATPFDQQQLRQAAYDEMCRIIREQRPMKPSARLSTLGDTAPEVSQRRQSDPTRLIHSVRGDLDWIVMKSLEKDRARRYEGANGLAADVERFLNHEAIEARPPSLTYRFGRVLARNRLLAASGLVVFMTISVALGITGVAMQERYEVLERYANQALEIAFERAFSGSEEEFEESYEIAQAAKLPQDWLDTLLGAHAFHAGDCTEAIKRFDAALDTNPDNTAAWALKAVALIDDGNFYKWTLHISDYEKHEPRPEFEAIDKLCIAYATYHVDLDDALARLEDVLQEHPNWNMARAIYAGALAEKGDKEGNPEFVAKSLHEISIAKHISPDNSLVQLVYVFTHNIAVREGVGEPRFMLKEAEPVVAQLAEKKNYAVGMLVVADFYRLLNEFAASKDSRLKELRAWKKVAAGRGNFASRAFAELYRAGESSAVYEASPNDPEAKIAQAFVLAQDVNRQDEARQILNDYRDAFESWYMRLKLLELSVLLRDDGAAIELCQRWRESAHLRKLDEFDPFRQELVHALADQRLDSLEVQNDWQRFLKQYFVALQLYAGGHVPEAKQRLEYCINHPSLNVADHWARAFYERWTD